MRCCVLRQVFIKEWGVELFLTNYARHNPVFAISPVTMFTGVVTVYNCWQWRKELPTAPITIFASVRYPWRTIQQLREFIRSLLILLYCYTAPFATFFKIVIIAIADICMTQKKSRSKSSERCLLPFAFLFAKQVALRNFFGAHIGPGGGRNLLKISARHHLMKTYIQPGPSRLIDLAESPTLLSLINKTYVCIILCILVQQSVSVFFCRVFWRKKR